MIRRIRLVLVSVIAVVFALLLYNLLRHFVFWGPSEEVSFASGDIRLAGTFVKPGKDGRYPVVILLHGSGPETRGDPPNRGAANALLRAGAAVLMYDKRGAGESGGDFASASYADFVDDALAAIDYVATRADTDPGRIGLYTISESGWLAPEIAVRSGRVHFIFNKVGPPLPWVDTVLWEVRNDYLADGVPESRVDELVELARQRWTYYQAAAADPSLASGHERDAINESIARLRAASPAAERVLDPQLLPYDRDDYARIAARSLQDPTPWLESLTIPLYYAFGELDVNIPTADSVRRLDALIAERDMDITYRVYPGVGHSLATWRGILNLGFPPGYLGALEGWVGQQLAGDAGLRH